MTINYLLDVKIVWTVHHGSKPWDSHAHGTWENWEFTITRGNRGGWDVKINGIQAWTHMRSFDEALRSVHDHLRDWAYIDQFKRQEPNNAERPST